ncbi:PIN domain-containing protein [Pseudomonas lopnurensis]|uniref:hypothetical protein n=1 Tax=Pseudomonas lopnurensis TaxID=1477517 RepID=UPI001879AF42|nr:hypothetical protein [Pseudomonas lopnurensis]MBE7375064.1 hypothetical protein [Pseudomonas lopnurensis]
MRLSGGARYARGPCLPSWGLVAHGETDQGSSRTAERGNGEEYVFAALVDGENLSSALLGSILLEAEKAGIAAIRKVYGDWTKPGMASWMQPLQEK